ncbi:hypothetical protein [Shewanella sp. UCD-KL21]|uniref:hypothetical protein n=1 Tax=Shewanella sp. UCD-KL21 TaxID=1917164 RepID=UPI00097051FA|nr:hypothetical protein [Shewanella sp. UCD-KL21]
MFKFLFTLTSTLLLSACATQAPDPELFAGKYRDTFSSSIKGEGIKLFTYKAKVANATDRGIEDPLPHQQRVNRRKQDARSYAREQERRADFLALWSAQVDLGLEKTLDMNGYCKEGYIVLHRNVSEGRGEIRGECNDGATEADIQKFSRKY